MATIYRKTDKGHEEIATRQHRLPMRLRSALILVDGKRSDKELLQMVLGGSEDTLTTLLEQGFIEAIAVTAERSSGGATSTASTTPAATTGEAPAPAPPVAPRTLIEMQRQSVRFLTDQLGPMAEGICQRIEGAKTAEQVNTLLVRARDVLRDARGASVAEQFSRQFLDQA